MRVFAVIVLLITVTAIGLIAFCYFGAQMHIVDIYPTLTPAAGAAEAFEELKRQLKIDSFLGAVYHDVDLTNAESFAFLTLTVRMQNKGLLDQDYIQIHIQNHPADILQLAADRTPSLAGLRSADFSATLLIPAENADVSRDVRVTYYVLGRPYEASFMGS